MGAVGVACNIALCASSGVFTAKWKHVAAMTAPVSSNVRDRLEPVRNAVIDLLLVIILHAMGQYHILQ